jgi:hypothetical protein
MKGVIIKPGDGTILSHAEFESGHSIVWVDRTINSILSHIS